MRSTTLLALLIAFTLIRLFLPTILLPTSAPRAAATDTTDTTYLPLVWADGRFLAERREVIRLVNIERVASGCAAADENPILMRAAQAWSDYMTAHDIFDHTDAYPGDWYAEHGWPYSIMGENIAGQTSPAGAVTLWMNSPAHRTALLTCAAGPTYTYDIGVGCTPSGWTLTISAQ